MVDAPAAVLIASGVGGAVSLITLSQKWATDRRTSWWGRAQPAINLTLEEYADDPAALSENDLDKLAIAQIMLNALQAEPGLPPTDYDVVVRVLDRIERLLRDPSS